jgi:hypothetical protein
MRVYEDEEPPKTLAKIGDYYTEAGLEMTEPVASLVNWEVL